MFYAIPTSTPILPIKHTKHYTQTSRLNITKSQPYFNSFFSAHTHTVFVFRKSSKTEIIIPAYLKVRFSRLSGLSHGGAVNYLTAVTNSLVNHFSFNTLYFFLSQFFWVVPVPKHKQLLYMVRAIVKFVAKHTSSIDGLTITFRGKLAVTGNKRKSAFTTSVGRGAPSSYNLLKASEFRLLQTPTGVIGVTSSITYTH